MNKELQEEYIRVKDKLDKLQDEYWSIDDSELYKMYDSQREEMIEFTMKQLLYTSREVAEFHVDLKVIGYYKDKYKKGLESQIIDTYTLLKSLNKQMYYNEG